MQRIMHIILAAFLSGFVSTHGYLKKRYFLIFARSKSLSLSGALTSFFVGLFAMWAGLDYTAAVLSFYFSSSFLTKLGTEKKAKIEEDFKKGGQRTIWQVLCNGGTGIFLTVLALFYPNLPPNSEFILRYCYVCHYAVCNGDTWASEIGSAYGGIPRLITNLRKVPPCTNGGVTLLGLTCSFLGGSFVGLWVYVITYMNGAMQIFDGIFTACLICGIFGFFGSLIDSFLGATLQVSFYDEKNGRIIKRGNKCGENIKIISGIDILTNGQVFLCIIFYR